MVVRFGRGDAGARLCVTRGLDRLSCMGGDVAFGVCEVVTNEVGPCLAACGLLVE